MTKLSKEKGCDIIGRWRKACVHQVYWAVISAQEHLGEVNWQNSRHFCLVINKHRNLPNWLFNACAHGEIATPRVWMTKGTKKQVAMHFCYVTPKTNQSRTV